MKWFGVILIVIVAIPCFAVQIVLKNGKVVQGAVISETPSILLLKNSTGTIVNIKKEEIDQQKTAEAKKTPLPETKEDSPAPEKKGVRKYTKEDLARLREEYDLGAGTFGEAYKIDLGSPEPEEADAPDVRNFDKEVLNSRIPVMVDFWASWCGPCRRIAPTIDAVAKDFSGRVKVIRVNIDEQEEIARRYDVDAIPTLIFFKDGEPVDQLVGVYPKQVIADKLEELLH